MPGARAPPCRFRCARRQPHLPPTMGSQRSTETLFVGARNRRTLACAISYLCSRSWRYRLSFEAWKSSRTGPVNQTFHYPRFAGRTATAQRCSSRYASLVPLARGSCCISVLEDDFVPGTRGACIRALEDPIGPRLLFARSQTRFVLGQRDWYSRYVGTRCATDPGGGLSQWRVRNMAPRHLM